LDWQVCRVPRIPNFKPVKKRSFRLSWGSSSNDQTRFSCRFLACFGDDRFLLFCGAFFIIVSIFDVALDFQKLSFGIFDFFDDDCI
ncbi:hypothetical protein, partial [Ligilactobacillus ruminis]|uniref:hypothetical protein n=1 Tax=Ligilactobacillus ruminis TaxID=1623 RepID=UPI0019D3B23B